MYLTKGRNTKPSSKLNAGNVFNKLNSNNCEPERHLSCKVKPFARANLHELLSDLLADDNEHEDADAGVEDVLRLTNINLP